LWIGFKWHVFHGNVTVAEDLQFATEDLVPVFHCFCGVAGQGDVGC
jgi:hypothetical protein